MSIPDIMNAAPMRGHGGPEVLAIEARPVPRPSAGQVLIQVEAAGVIRTAKPVSVRVA